MPFYTDLPKEEIRKRAEIALNRLEGCDLCPRECGANRQSGESGLCGAGARLRVSSVFPHHGEEPAISGTEGSGTIFFSHCTMRCRFCQNYQISHEGHGEYREVEDLAREMLGLQARGCHNINLVTPTQYVPHIIPTLSLAIERGLSIPIVYNTNGFDSLYTLMLLDGLVDIYLPDIKYADSRIAKELSECPDYVRHNRAALKEMRRQVGPLVCGPDGVAQQGLLIRHLVLPENLAGTEESMQWVARELGKDVCISLMAQYSPLYQAGRQPPLDRRITKEEYFSAVESLHRAGLGEGWIQDWEGMDGHYIIDFISRKRERLK
jgi:putative pyruvate formate lyase activating enzyme